MSKNIKVAMNYLTSCSMYHKVVEHLLNENKLKGYDQTLFMLSKRCVQKLSIVWHYLTCEEKIPNDIQLEITGSDDQSIWTNLRVDAGYKSKVKTSLEESVPVFQKLLKVCKVTYKDSHRDQAYLINDNIEQIFGHLLPDNIVLLMRTLFKKWEVASHDEKLVVIGYTLSIIHQFETDNQVNYELLQKLETTNFSQQDIRRFNDINAPELYF